MNAAIRWCVAVLGLLLGGGLVAAHVRLVHPGTKAPLYWSTPTDVSVVIQQAGSADLSDGSHVTALRNAIAAWNAAPGSVARLVEDTNPNSQARTDWQADDIHLVLFDEDNSSGYFPFGSGIVALTPIWFFSSGRISDADILFNGSGFSFTTSAQPGRFDIQDVGAHELGHLLGLDHSGWAGATMFPFVDSTVILHRSLALDDVVGLRSAYPAMGFATISGRVERADSSPVAGAQVVALDGAGRTRAGILTGNNGNFTLTGLDGGTYTLYAAPLDGPVLVSNLTGGQTVQIDFQPTWYGAPVTVAPGASAQAGTLVVLPDALINLGRPTDRLPLRATSGQETLLSLRGTGLAAGSSLVPSDPLLGVSVQNWLGSTVIFRVTVPAGAEPGHVDLTVENSLGERSVLTAALEIAPPAPQVSSVQPSVASSSGGDLVTILGNHFRPGARVVIGPHIYADGEPGGAQVIGPNEIRLTLAPTAAGVHDAVVIDATGVEGRLVDGLTAAALPALQSVFPAVGSQAGGTTVRIAGASFAPGAVVRIDGLVQQNVQWLSATALEFVTAGGPPGGPYTLEVENPGGYVASALFSYVAQPDPTVSGVQPPSAPSGGGLVVTVSGSGFGPGTQVLFGADPLTGQGGVAAPSVALVDSGTLSVLTPPGKGSVSVVVRELSTGQAAVAPASFVFQSSGGGGGGCTVAQSPSDRGTGGWLLLLLLWAALASRSAQRRRLELARR